VKEVEKVRNIAILREMSIFQEAKKWELRQNGSAKEGSSRETQELS